MKCDAMESGYRIMVSGKNKLTSYCLILVFLLLVTTDIFSQQYNLTRFTNRDGLGQSQCTALTKDQFGRIWGGTNEGGVSRYDGQKMVTFYAGNGLSSNFIRDLEHDGQNVWIATGNGITWFDGIEFGHLFALDSGNYGVKLLAVHQESVYAVDDDNQLLRIIDFQAENISNKLPSLKSEITAVLIDAGSLYVGTESEGLHVIPLDKPENTSHIGVNSGLFSNHIRDLEKKGENILIATPKGVNSMFKNEVNVFNPYERLQGIDVRRLKVIGDKFWAGTSNGAYLFEGIKHLFIGERNGLSGVAMSIENDNDNGVWFSTSTGLYRLNNRVFATYTERHGLNDSWVWDVEIARNGEVWACTEKGINILSGKGNLSSPIDLPYELKNSPSPIFSDKNGDLFIAGESSLYKHDGTSFEKVRFSHSGFSGRIRCGKETSTWGLLIGTSEGMYQKEEDVLRKFSMGDLLDIARINDIVETSDGTLWVATNEHGLFQYSKKSWSQIDVSKGLPSPVVNSLWLDKSENLWLGTSGAGLCKIPSDERERIVTYEEISFPSPNVYFIQGDVQNNIWIGTDQGICRVKTLQNDVLSVETYRDTEGFYPLEVSHNSATIDHEGALWVGTIEGLVRIDTKREVFTDATPKVFVEGVKLYYEDFNYGEYASGLDTITGLPIGLQLPYERNHIMFEFVGISMNVPEKVTYRWKLQGIDDSWAPASTLGKAVYPNLPSGKYTFMVEAANAKGTFTENPAVFSFSVKSPFYLTRWFLTSTVILAFAILYWIVRMRVKKLHRQQESLRRKVKERTSEIEVQKAEIEAQSEKLGSVLVEIEKKNSELSNINQDILSSLNYAGRIQQALFPDEESIQRLLPQSFVLSIKKSIVSGDFFWTKETKEYIYIILADCTGSGVPAAFISIIGFDYLQQIINEQCCLSPGDLLFQLHEKVRKALHPEDNTELNDGIDIAMARIEKATGELQFSGARRPMIVVQDHDLTMIKGSFSSIGIYFSKLSPEFKTHTLQLTPKSTVYVFSDGFPNQFGVNGKKYKTSRFRSFLQQISEETELGTQRDLLENEFFGFKEDEEQIDDVTVIGFRWGNGGS